MLKVKESPRAKTLEQKDIFKAIHRSQHCQRKLGFRTIYSTRRY